MISFVAGNIFDAQVEALVNPVNCVGVMGKGLAKEFKNRFIENYKAYVSVCVDKNLKIGTLLVCNLSENLEKPFYIINFPTKHHWRNYSKIEYIESGLIALASLIRSRNIKSIAIPSLGCGLGGLNWQEVKEVMTKHLSWLEDVKILIYEPKEEINI